MTDPISPRITRQEMSNGVTVYSVDGYQVRDEAEALLAVGITPIRGQDDIDTLCASL